MEYSLSTVDKALFITMLNGIEGDPSSQILNPLKEEVQSA
jgi:hypothetical protein